MGQYYKLIGSSSGGGGGGGGTPFSDTMNSSTDWGSPSGGYYSITITAGTHGKGTSPVVQVFELISGSFEDIGTDIIVNSSGDVSVRVTSVPDNRFAGKIIIV